MRAAPRPPRRPRPPVLSTLLAAALLAGCAGTTVVTDVDFEASQDPTRGWTVVGDGDLGTAEGQVRDGALVGQDDTEGGVWYFAAPGDVAAALEPSAFVSFALRLEDAPTDPFDAPDVVVGSGTTAIHARLPSSPDTAWTTYELDLDLLDWRQGSVVDGELDAALDDPGAPTELVAEVLGDADLLWLRGEYDSGPDTAHLDDVRITVG